MPITETTGPTGAPRRSRRPRVPRRPLYTYPAVYLPWALGFVALIVWLASSMFRTGPSDPRSQDATLTAAPVLVSTPPVPKAATPHLVFAYSVVRGGVHHPEDARRAVGADPLVARHYRDIALGDLRAIRTTTPRTAYMSYRIGDRIAWTRNPVVIPAGELLLTNGTHEIRGRSGGRLSVTPVSPVADDEPAAEVMDLVVASDDTKSGGGTGATSPLSGEGPPPAGVTSPGQTNPSSDLPPPIARGGLDPSPQLTLPSNQPAEGLVSSTLPPGPTGERVPGAGGVPGGGATGPSGGVAPAGSNGGGGSGSGSGGGSDHAGGSGDSGGNAPAGGTDSPATGTNGGSADGSDSGSGNGSGSAPAGSGGTGTGGGSGATIADQTPTGEGGGPGSPGGGTQAPSPAGVPGPGGATTDSTGGGATPGGAGDNSQPRLPGHDDVAVTVGTQDPPPRQIPEPATFYLVGAGVAAGLAWRRHVRRARRTHTSAAAQRDDADVNDRA